MGEGEQKRFAAELIGRLLPVAVAVVPVDEGVEDCFDFFLVKAR